MKYLRNVSPLFERKWKIRYTGGGGGTISPNEIGLISLFIQSRFIVSEDGDPSSIMNFNRVSVSEYTLKGSIHLVGERHRQEGPWRLSNVYWRNTRSITPPLSGNLSPRSRYILIYQLRKACLEGGNVDLRNPLRNPFRVASSLSPLRDTATSLQSPGNEAVSSTRLPPLWKSLTPIPLPAFIRTNGI